MTTWTKSPRFTPPSADPTCPTCGHKVTHHAEQQHWPEGLCSQCRREMDPFVSGNPRRAEDVCQHTSSQVRALIAGGVA